MSHVPQIALAAAFVLFGFVVSIVAGQPHATRLDLVFHALALTILAAGATILGSVLG